jgi:hypothetical protein
MNAPHKQPWLLRRLDHTHAFLEQNVSKTRVAVLDGHLCPPLVAFLRDAVKHRCPDLEWVSPSPPDNTRDILRWAGSREAGRPGDHRSRNTCVDVIVAFALNENEEPGACSHLLDWYPDLRIVVFPISGAHGVNQERPVVATPVLLSTVEEILYAIGRPPQDEWPTGGAC